jgi:hypothetical protein
VVHGEPDHRGDQRLKAAIGRDRNLAGVAANEDRLVFTSGLDRDIRAGVARANDEDRTRLKLRWVSIVHRMELTDARVELFCPCRSLRGLVTAGGDDDGICD